jgi:hypothetical protein
MFNFQRFQTYAAEKRAGACGKIRKEKRFW